MKPRSFLDAIVETFFGSILLIGVVSVLLSFLSPRAVSCVTAAALVVIAMYLQFGILRPRS